MKRVVWLSVLAQLPAAVGYVWGWRPVAEFVATMLSGQAPIAALAFFEGAGRASEGLLASAAALLVLALVQFVKAFRTNAEQRRGLWLASLVPVVAGLLLMALSRHAIAVGEAFRLLSPFAAAGDEVPDLVASALAAAKLWFGVLGLLVCVELGLLAWQLRGRAAWLSSGIIALSSVTFVGVQVAAIHEAQAFLAARQPPAFPPEFELVSLDQASVRLLGGHLDLVDQDTLLVGPQQIYWRGRSAKPKVLAAGQLLATPDCVESLGARLRAIAPGVAWPWYGLRIGLDSRTTFAAMSCVIRALQAPTPALAQVPRSADEAPDPVQTPQLEWLIRRETPALPAPFGAFAVPYALVHFDVAMRARANDQILTPAPLAREVLLQASQLRKPLLIVSQAATVATAANAIAATPPGATADQRVHVRFGAPDIVGRIADGIVQREVAKLTPPIEACARKAAERMPLPDARLAAHFVIGRDGSVVSVSNDGGNVQDQELATCVLRSFYDLSFPPSSQGIVVVMYPVFFQAVN